MIRAFCCAMLLASVASGQTIESLKSELKLAEAGKVVRKQQQPVKKHKLRSGKFRYTFNQPFYQRQLVEKLHTQIANKEAINDLLPESPEVGDEGIIVAEMTDDHLGTIKYECKIIQVLDDESLLASRVKHTPLYRIKTTQGGLKRHYIPNGTDHDDLGTIKLIMPTDGLVDGRVLDAAGTWHVTRTETYETAAGSNTVLVMERMR